MHPVLCVSRWVLGEGVLHFFSSLKNPVNLLLDPGTVDAPICASVFLNAGGRKTI